VLTEDERVNDKLAVDPVEDGGRREGRGGGALVAPMDNVGRRGGGGGGAFRDIEPELTPTLILDVLEIVEVSVVVRRIIGLMSLAEVLSEATEKRGFAEEERCLSVSSSEAVSGGIIAPKKGLLWVSAGVKGFELV